MDLQNEFKNRVGSSDLFRNGAGFSEGGLHSKFKLCLTATNLETLMQTLCDVSQSDECFVVKYRPQPKAGMYLGPIVMTSDEATGVFWRKLRSNPELFCSVQDDEFCRQYREKHT